MLERKRELVRLVQQQQLHTDEEHMHGASTVAQLSSLVEAHFPDAAAHLPPAIPVGTRVTGNSTSTFIPPRPYPFLFMPALCCPCHALLDQTESKCCMQIDMRYTGNRPIR